MADPTDPTPRDPWLPPGFRHASRVELLDDVHLRPIRADDVSIDYPAVLSSRERLWAQYGEAWGWPPATMTEKQDREDLEHHAREILAHQTFNYAVLNADETRLLGCVYLDPPRPSDDGDVLVSWWVIDELAGGPIEQALDTFVPHWVTDAWPFQATRNRPLTLSELCHASVWPQRQNSPSRESSTYERRLQSRTDRKRRVASPLLATSETEHVVS